MWIVGQTELADHIVGLDLVVHGHQGGFATIEQNGSFDVSCVTRLKVKKKYGEFRIKRISNVNVSFGDSCIFYAIYDCGCASNRT